MKPIVNKNNEAKPASPSRSTLFYVDSIGVSAIDGKTYATGSAFNIETQDFEPMAVTLHDKEGYERYYRSIYDDSSDAFIKNQAASEFKTVSPSNSLGKDFSIKGVVENTMERGIMYALKKERELDIADITKLDESMYQDISGRFLLALDNLEVTHEGVLNNQKVKMGVATRAQSMNPHTNTVESSVVKALGYVSYTRPSESEDGKDNSFLRTYEASAQTKVSQLAGDNKHKMQQVILKGLDNTLGAYGMPDAERNGSLDIQINFLNENNKREEYKLSVAPYLDLAKKYNSEERSYMPRVDSSKFLFQINEGFDYDSNKYREYLTGSKSKKLPNFDRVAKHDFVRFLNTLTTDYDAAMRGDYVQMLKDEDRAKSPLAMDLQKVQEAMIRNPDKAYLSMESTTLHMFQKDTKVRVNQTKNAEWIEKLKARGVDEELIKRDTIVKRPNEGGKSLNSVVLSVKEKDEKGYPKKADIVSPMMMTLIRATDDNGQKDSNAVVVGIRGVSALVPYPSVKKLDGVHRYLEGTQAYFSTLSLPDGAAQKHLNTFDTNFDSTINPLKNPQMLNAATALKQSLSLYPKVTTEVYNATEEQRENGLPLKNVRPYHFNPPVSQPKINENAARGNRNDNLTDKQKKRIICILGTYKFNEGRDTPDGRRLDDIFNTDYKKQRVEAFFEAINERHENFFMSVETAKQNGYKTGGGMNVMRELLDNPPADSGLNQTNIYKEFGDVLRPIIDTSVTDRELQLKYAPVSTNVEPATISSAIPLAADSQNIKIDSLYPRAAINDKQQANALNDILGVNSNAVNIPISKPSDNDDLEFQKNQRATRRLN